MENVFQPPSCLENKIERSLLNKRKQLTLNQFFLNRK